MAMDYVIIESIDDIPSFVEQVVACAGEVVVTPNVAVYLKLKRAGYNVERMGVTQGNRSDILKVEKKSKSKVLRLRHDISEYLNNKDGYEFRGCHHPDYCIQYYKRLLFSVEYRYVLLFKILGLDCFLEKQCRVGVFSQSNIRTERFIDNSEDWPDNLFQADERSFSKVLEWAHPDLISRIDEDGNDAIVSECDDDGSKYAVKDKFIYGLRRSAAQLYYDMSFRIKHHGERVVLYDNIYPHTEFPCPSNGAKAYDIRRHVLMASLNKFKQNNTAGIEMANHIVSSVFEDVIDKHNDDGMYEINGFNYYSYIKELLREYLFDEIVSFYWAEMYVNKHFSRYSIDSMHSDAPHFIPIYAVHKFLSKKRGVATYGYPHGAEGYYDYFWQERFTTAAVDNRIVGSIEQKRHFEEQQERCYMERYHTNFLIRPLKCSKRYSIEKGDVQKYNVVYVMDVTHSDLMYTIENYPDPFEFYYAQKSIIDSLIKVCRNAKTTLCIKTKYGIRKEMYENLFSGVHSGVKVETEGDFLNMMDVADKIVIDCPSTVLFQSLERGKDVMCVNSYNKVDENLLKHMENSGVVYVDYDSKKMVDIEGMMVKFIKPAGKSSCPNMSFP